MKIDFILSGRIDQTSGGYLYDRELVDHLREHGDEVEVLSLPAPSRSPLTALRRRRAFLERVFDSPRDVLLEDELAHAALTRLNERLRRPEACCPVIAAVHHLRMSEAHGMWGRFFARRAETAFLAGVDGFVFNSHDTCRAVLRLLRRPRPFVVAHPGRTSRAPLISAEAVRRRVETEGPLRIVYLGNVIARKGLHVLLEALARLHAVEWELDVIGDLTLDRGYSRRVQRLAMRDATAGHVHFIGLASEEIVRDKLRAGHVLAMPSQHEGFGIAYLEAMSFGMPVIATSSGGASELVRDLTNGFLVDPEDAAGLVSRLRLLARERERLLEMSLNALRRAAECPTWHESAQKIRSFLLEQVRASKLGVARGLATPVWWEEGPAAAGPDAGSERSAGI